MAAGEYLAVRRALGFRLTAQGQQLMSCVSYCEARGADRVTADLALEWATRTARGSAYEVYQARRLVVVVVRIFARHLKALDPATEIPPGDVLPHHYRRIPAYLYTPGEVAALMTAGSDGVVRLCHPVTGQPVGVPVPADPGTTVPIAPGGVIALAFSPDGTLLATADANGQVQLWARASFASPRAALCAEVGALAPRQWARYAPGARESRTCG